MAGQTFSNIGSPPFDSLARNTLLASTPISSVGDKHRAVDHQLAWLHMCESCQKMELCSSLVVERFLKNHGEYSLGCFRTI